jgi:predicted MFS family arabinose efflux permease
VRGDTFDPDASDETRLSYEGWRVAAAAGTGVFFASMVFFSFSILLKPLVDEFGWSRAAVSSAYGTLTLSAAVSAPFIGALIDRFRARRVCAPALAMLGCAFASLALLTPRLWHLHLVFAAAGMATTGTSAVAYARVISTWFDRRRGRALALVMASSPVGALVFPPVTAALIRTVGWRRACLILGAVVLVAGVPAVVRFVREHLAPRSPATTVTSGATIGDASHSRVFFILVAVVFGSTLAVNSVIVHLSPLLTDRGVSSGLAALIVSSMGAASVIGRLVTGWLLDRVAAPPLSVALLAVASLGTFLLAGAASGAGGLLAAALIGFGSGGEADVVPFLLARHFGLRSLSTLYGVNWMAFGIAGAIGPLLMGLAYDATGSYARVLVAFSAVTLATALLMLAVPANAARPEPTTV